MCVHVHTRMRTCMHVCECACEREADKAGTDRQTLASRSHTCSYSPRTRSTEDVIQRFRNQQLELWSSSGACKYHSGFHNSCAF